ncbi:HTH domain-containing protein [Lysinibacillus sp. MHQ-1]|nr:HTH domain-containing protein [Lysinibacillus sp. MHQ-1]
MNVKKFTIQEMAEECGVSRRTMIRDLMELSELGVPLYSEAGPNGGYRVLREKSATTYQLYRTRGNCFVLCLPIIT